MQLCLKQINPNRSGTIHQDHIMTTVTAICRFSCSLWLIVICGTTLTMGEQTNSTNNAKLPAQSFLGMGGITTIPERMVSPHFTGSELPQPPRQKTPWSAPASSLPTHYVSATALLFEQGLADPRGCDYREIEVGTGEIWRGDGGIVKTHGWVLPGKEKEKFAVCWNGLVYPVVTVGEPADLRADIQDAISKAGRMWRNALPEGFTIAHESCLPIKGCLLLRLGEPELARQMWAALQIQAGKGVNFDAKPNVSLPEVDQVKLDEADPYLNLASDWAWGLFERAVCAHMRGDDGLALASARLLTIARPLIERAAEQRGFKRQESYNQKLGSRDRIYQDYLNFLEPLSSLLTDQERRAHRREPAMALADIVKMPNQTARISGLIGQLDQVAVRQWGQPGGLGPWGSDSHVAALLKEGKPAVEPLLQCLEGESCNRLTRSVSFGRDFHRGRWLHSVSEPVNSMLHDILDADNFGTWATAAELAPAGTNKNRITAIQIRAWLKKFSGQAPADRWYSTLLDDSAGIGLWIDAANNITKPVHPHGDTNITTLQGESLRTNKHLWIYPSVGKLLEKRINAVMPTGIADPPFGDMNALKNAGQLIETLARWDAEAAKPLLSRHMAIACAATDRTDYNFSNYGQVDCLSIIIGDTLARIHCGDSNALGDYARWLQGREPGQAFVDSRSPVNAGVDRIDQLKPAWMYPDHPAIVLALKRLLDDTNSPWCPSRAGTNGTIGLAVQLVATPLLEREVVFKYMQAGLAEQAQAGTVTYSSSPFSTNDIIVDYKFEAGWGCSQGVKMNAKLPSDTTRKYPFRVCDLFAEQLATVDGFPPFEMGWSLKERDDAIKAVAKFLNENRSQLGEMVDKKRKREWWRNR
jgi:hypothetical protein